MLLISTIFSSCVHGWLTAICIFVSLMYGWIPERCQEATASIVITRQAKLGHPSDKKGLPKSCSSQGGWERSRPIPHKSWGFHVWCACSMGSGMPPRAIPPAGTSLHPGRCGVQGQAANESMSGMRERKWYLFLETPSRLLCRSDN